MMFETLLSNLIFASLFFTVTSFFWSQSLTDNKVNPPSVELGVPLDSKSAIESAVSGQENFGFKNFDFSQIGVIISSFFLSLLLGERWFESGHPPMSNLYESLLFLTWSFLFFYLLFKHSEKSEKIWEESPNTGIQPQRQNFSRILGMILLSTALFTYTFANWRLPSSMQSIEPLVPALQSNWLLMHVSIMLLSYGALLSGSLMAITYLVVYSFLKKKDSALSDLEIHQESNLLQNLDNFSARTLSFAFPMLSLGIISGAVWANEAWGSYWSWDPKETWALITWLIFAIYLHIRINKGWIGQKSALVATLGFFMIWLSYLGVNLLGKGLHSYGWWNS